MTKIDLLEYLYSKLKATPDKNNQVYFVENDYKTVNGGAVNQADIIEINKSLRQLQCDGYIQCPRLKDSHVYAAWITLIKNT